MALFSSALRCSMKCCKTAFLLLFECRETRSYIYELPSSVRQEHQTCLIIAQPISWNSCAGAPVYFNTFSPAYRRPRFAFIFTRLYSLPAHLPVLDPHVVLVLWMGASYVADCRFQVFPWHRCVVAWRCY